MKSFKGQDFLALNGGGLDTSERICFIFKLIVVVLWEVRALGVSNFDSQDLNRTTFIAYTVYRQSIG